MENNELSLKFNHITKLAGLYKRSPEQICAYLLCEDDMTIHKNAETNDAFTTQGSVVQHRDIDNTKFDILFSILSQNQQMLVMLLAEKQAKEP